MTIDDIVTALRCCSSIDGEYECSSTCVFYKTSDELGDCCTKKNIAAAEVIEVQQRYIEYLIAQRENRIERFNQYEANK